MITHFTIFGERCSGTTYLENIMLLNFDIQITWKYGWKHFPIFNRIYEDSDNVLFICIVRNISDWLNSFYKDMHHLALKYKENLSQEEKMDAFLNKEFLSIYDISNEIIEDRNLYTGERYKNIFEMRSTKLQYIFEKLPELVNKYILIKHEDLINDFGNTMNKIKDMGLKVNNINIFPKNTLKYKGEEEYDCNFIKKSDNIISKKTIFENKNFLKYDKYERIIYKDFNSKNNLATVFKDVNLDIFNNIGNSKKMLVFGLGSESKIWYEKNGKNTYFVEDKDEKINKFKEEIPIENIIKYEYKTSCKTSGLLKSKQIKEFKLPEELLRLTPFDIIFIDGPENYHSGGYIKKYWNKPGRLIPCYWSSLITKSGSIIYLNSSEHALETYYIQRFFNSNVKEEFIGVNKCTKIYC